MVLVLKLYNLKDLSLRSLVVLVLSIHYLGYFLQLFYKILFFYLENRTGHIPKELFQIQTSSIKQLSKTNSSIYHIPFFIFIFSTDYSHQLLLTSFVLILILIHFNQYLFQAINPFSFVLYEQLTTNPIKTIDSFLTLFKILSKLLRNLFQLFNHLLPPTISYFIIELNQFLNNFLNIVYLRKLDQLIQHKPFVISVLQTHQSKYLLLLFLVFLFLIINIV